MNSQLFDGFWRDGIREFTAQVKLGDFGEMTARQARGKAKEALGLIEGPASW